MSMSSSLDSFFENAMFSVHTSLPATVVEYDEGTHRAKVKPSVQMLMSNGVQIDLPELMDVPVIFPAAKSFDLEFPLDKDDGVLLMFQESDISSWKNGDPEAAAETSSRFNLDSAVAVPGLIAKPKKGSCSISVDADGNITFKANQIIFETPAIFKKEVTTEGRLTAKDDAFIHGNVIAGTDVLVGTPGTVGVSFSTHIHPTTSPGAPTGTGESVPPMPIPPEV